MNVLMISPGYPAEMPYFTRGLAEVGATVIGLGDQPGSALPEIARASVATHLQVRSLADEADVMRQVAALAAKTRLDRVECLWEPYMILAARLREMLEIPGPTVEQTLPFRDKEIMKDVLDAAGIRTPRHGRATSISECRAVAERVGFPLIVKPVAGAGSADTYRVDSEGELEQVFPALRHVPQVTVEEFIEGEDMTFDTLTVGGMVAHYNICRYWPRALESKMHEWLSPITYSLRDVEAEDVAAGREMGFAVLAALGFETGYTHMEWYRTADGEAVFGEIAARPPGVRTVDLINLRERHRHLPGLGRRGRPRDVVTAGGKEVQRLLDRETRTGTRPDRTHRGARPPAAGVRRPGVQPGPPPDRRAPPQLEGDARLRRDDLPPTPRPGHAGGDRRRVLDPTPALRRLTCGRRLSQRHRRRRPGVSPVQSSP